MDDEGNQVRYFYDAQGRVVTTGAGATGLVDRTEYQYNGDGQLTKTLYYTGANHYDVNYTYNSAGQLVTMTDWLPSEQSFTSDGIHYAYDGNGRLTQITDYDDTALNYTYDAAGNVVTMVDYHDNMIVYTYTGGG